MKKTILLLSFQILSHGLFAFNDQDRDGLSDDLETSAGMDPYKPSYFPDSDGDGFADYIEIFYQSDPGNRLSHPRHGTPFGINNIGGQESLWNTVDIGVDDNSTDGAVLLGDGSIVIDFNQYTPFRPFVKVVDGEGFGGSAFGIQSDGQVFEIGSNRNEISEALPFRIFPKPHCDYEIIMGSFWIERSNHGEIRILQTDPLSDHTAILTNPGTKILQADEDHILARSPSGEFFVWPEMARIDVDLSWAQYVFVCHGELLAISDAGIVYSNVSLHSVLNFDFEFDGLPTDPPHPGNFVVYGSHDNRIFGVLPNGILQEWDSGSHRWNGTGISFSIGGTTLVAAGTSLSFTDSHVLLSYASESDPYAILEAEDLPSASGVPNSFFAIDQIDWATRFVGNSYGVVALGDFGDGFAHADTIEGNNQLNFENEIYLEANLRGYGLVASQDYDHNGFSDEWEDQYGEVTIPYSSALFQSDIDSDGIEDALEVFIGTIVGEEDSNFDGIDDGLEFLSNYGIAKNSSLNPFYERIFRQAGFMDHTGISNAGFIHRSEAITTTISQPNISLDDNSIYMEWSVLESDDLLNWEVTDQFVIQKELTGDRKFFRVLMNE